MMELTDQIAVGQSACSLLAKRAARWSNRCATLGKAVAGIAAPSTSR